MGLWEEVFFWVFLVSWGLWVDRGVEVVDGILLRFSFSSWSWLVSFYSLFHAQLWLVGIAKHRF
jgi:hypothetical protein